MLRVLFVGSSNTGDLSAILKAQIESLRGIGLLIDIFPIKGKGVWGYLKNVQSLRKFLKVNEYDLIHAHYGLCGLVACLAKTHEKIIVSYMGDDIIGSNRLDGSVTTVSLIFAKLNVLLSKKYYDFSIVKSDEMLKKVKGKNVRTIPNGVNLELFYPKEKLEARNLLKLDPDKKIIIFISNPLRTEKNYGLAVETLKILNNSKIELIKVFGKKQTDLVLYYNAADLLILTSHHEGSPNVIKEAMACCCPIVSTNVGDVNWIIGKTEGCFISSFNPEDFAEKIKLALDFSIKNNRTNGRDRIVNLSLDSESIAKKIFEVYQKVRS